MQFNPSGSGVSVADGTAAVACEDGAQPAIKMIAAIAEMSPLRHGILLICMLTSSQGGFGFIIVPLFKPALSTTPCDLYGVTVEIDNESLYNLLPPKVDSQFIRPLLSPTITTRPSLWRRFFLFQNFTKWVLQKFPNPVDHCFQVLDGVVCEFSFFQKQTPFALL